MTRKQFSKRSAAVWARFTFLVPLTTTRRNAFARYHGQRWWSEANRPRGWRTARAIRFTLFVHDRPTSCSDSPNSESLAVELPATISSFDLQLPYTLVDTSLFQILQGLVDLVQRPETDAKIGVRTEVMAQKKARLGSSRERVIVLKLEKLL